MLIKKCRGQARIASAGMRSLSPICFITSTGHNFADISGYIKSLVLPALESGIRWIQYRDKDRNRREIYSIALRLREITGEFSACLIINDHADIALAVDADGVHLGQDDLPLREARKIMGTKVIGISTHTVAEAIEAERGGADYIGFGPIFHTTTKDAGFPKGAESITEIRNAVKIPVIAIGGIKPDNLELVLGAGCSGVAVSSGISAGDVRTNVKAFLSRTTSGQRGIQVECENSLDKGQVII